MTATKKPNPEVPTGDALRKVLAHFYPVAGYVLYGDRVEPHAIGEEQARGLVWDESNEMSRPTTKMLAQQWKQLKAIEQTEVDASDRDWAGFKEEGWGLLKKCFTCEDIAAQRAFLYLIDNPVRDINAWIGAFKDVRQGMPEDWTSAELDQLWTIAQTHKILIDRKEIEV